ncbi:hypothetical protein PIB30_043866 [Stylosanthes scabra]|uniref:Ribonuclease H1 N-terminal domain-containing protein n=1 Tax=Stylosanthes scabra TaxID=79078 RepID=A0ABU6QGD1_9FABA|nr:hypothetical protein [Stylosanthes scabra]
MAQGGGKCTHYAVRVGRVPGIYRAWDEAEVHVSGYPRAKYKGFKSLEEALDYMNGPSSQKLKGTSSQNVERLTPQMQKLGMWLSQPSATQTWLGGRCNVGCPTFEPREFYSQFGSKMYACTAALRSEEMGINLEVEGRVCPDKNRAREDAAYNLLQQLLTVTGSSIMDFNYRRLVEAERNLEEKEHGTILQLRSRVAELEATCTSLRKEIENFHEFLAL